MKENLNLFTHYQWIGINKEGEKSEGFILAQSEEHLKALLRKDGIIIKKIVKKPRGLFNRYKKIKSRDIASFARQLATLFKAGIPLIQSFEIIAATQKNLTLRSLIDTIQKDVSKGLTFSESLIKHPSYFNALFCNLINIGEKSGTLDIMLERVATLKEKMESFKKKIKNMLMYPLVVFLIAFIVMSNMLIFVVPQFETLFKSFGAKLPGLTIFIIHLSQFFKSFSLIILVILSAFIVSLIYASKHSLFFSNQLDRFLLKMPLLGELIKKTSIARFARTLSITHMAGLPLVEALTAVAKTCGNKVYVTATYSIKENISLGQTISKAMAHTGVFPHNVIQMIAIGEESGTLEKMLTQVANFYEEAVNNTVESLSSLLEPIIMAILGVLVGTLVLAMYLPIFKLGSVV